jgi:hypothetical protein
MSDLDPFADALREARAALLNPELSNGERDQVVRVIEGALDLAKIMGPNAEIIRPATDEDLRLMAAEDSAGPYPP